MKSIIFLFVLCFSFAVFGDKDPKINLVKKASIVILNQYLSTHFTNLRVNVLDQSNEYFLTQVITPKQNYCLVLQLTMQDGVPEYTVIENNNDMKNVFIEQCEKNPSVQELKYIKQLNKWPERVE